MHKRQRLAFAVALLGIASSPDRFAAGQAVRAGNASITNDAEAGTWTIASAGAALTLAIDAARDFQVVGLVSPSGQTPIAAAMADTTVRVGSTNVALGSRSAGFVFNSVATSVERSTVRLDAAFDLPSARLRVTRHYVAASGSPTFETWTTFTPLERTVTLSDLNALRLTLRPGPIHWVNGLQGDDPNRHVETAFTHQQRELSAGNILTLGAQGRSSEETVPWWRVDLGGDQWFMGLMWSGAWSLRVSRSDSGLDATLGLGAMTLTTSTPVDGPHAIFGVVSGGPAEAAAAVRAFVVDGVRGGRGFKPLVTLNTWFAYGVEIDEASMLAAIDAAADAGVELFVLDAGWYAGAGREGASDFASGLGSWTVDASRFPSGLRALSDHAHARGLKFGIWVEPERIALSLVNQRGFSEAWLAKNGGKYGAAREAQICLASEAARQWLLDELTRLIDSVQPDYVKWDNNFWINCDRSGHGHGASDGNFAHVNGLYTLLATLRQRYPNLVIENVSGGGNRLDLGMLRYSDVAWMDDRSAPSAVVRRNVEGLGVVLPPAYLLSFVMDDPHEPIHFASDLALYFRSRMLATLGLCVRLDEFSNDDLAEMRREIAIYKEMRSTLERGSGALITGQAAAGAADWDVFQTTTSRSRFATLLAFRGDLGSQTIIVTPVRLRPDFHYEVSSVELGVLGVESGATLMRDGIEIANSPFSAAHILKLRRVQR